MSMDIEETVIHSASEAENILHRRENGKLDPKIVTTERRYRTLLEINNAIITSLTEEELLRAIYETFQRIIRFDRIGMTIYDPETDAFRFSAIEGEAHSDYFVVGQILDRETTLAGRDFDPDHPLLIHDLEKERQNDFEERLFADGVLSFCGVPLVAHGKTVGTIGVSSQKRNQYSEADAEFLKEAGSQIALAIANMKAYEEIAALKVRLHAENVYLQEEIRREHNFDEIVGNSPALIEALRQVEQVAATDSSVIIYGETGTGKELIARALHDLSDRKHRPLVKVNCGAISAGLVESELFGHVKGAFTGAVERRTGRFELANGGTLFLDEVGELPLDTQVKLLRVLQEQEFEPVGSNRTVRVNVRIIAATNRDLEEAVRGGRFRSDLYYRLNVFPLHMPPLRERQSDVPQLVMFFLSRFSRKFGKKIESVPKETLNLLMNYSWPGNIRELENIIERAVILSSGSVLTLNSDIVPALKTDDRSAPHEKIGAQEYLPSIANLPSARPVGTLKDVERLHILNVLDQTGWVIEGPKGAATVLNLHPNTLRSRIKRLGIKRPSHS